MPLFFVPAIHDDVGLASLKPICNLKLEYTPCSRSK